MRHQKKVSSVKLLPQISCQSLLPNSLVQQKISKLKLHILYADLLPSSFFTTSLVQEKVPSVILILQIFCQALLQTYLVQEKVRSVNLLLQISCQALLQTSLVEEKVRSINLLLQISCQALFTNFTSSAKNFCRFLAQLF